MEQNISGEQQMKKLFFALVAVVALTLTSCLHVVNIDVTIGYTNGVTDGIATNYLGQLNEVYTKALRECGEPFAEGAVLRNQSDTKKAEELAKTAGEKAHAEALKINGISEGTKDNYNLSYTIRVSGGIDAKDIEISKHYYLAQ